MPKRHAEGSVSSGTTPWDAYVVSTAWSDSSAAFGLPVLVFLTHFTAQTGASACPSSTPTSVFPVSNSPVGQRLARGKVPAHTRHYGWLGSAEHSHRRPLTALPISEVGGGRGGVILLVYASTLKPHVLFRAFKQAQKYSRPNDPSHQ